MCRSVDSERDSICAGLWVAFSDCSMCIFSLRAGFQLSTLEACGFVQSSWRFSEKLCVPVSRGMCGASEF